MAREHHKELQTTNSTAAMAKLAVVVTKITKMLQLSSILQFPMYDA